MDTGYQIAEAILWRYNAYKQPSREEVEDAAYCLYELTQVTDDKWIRKAFDWIVSEYDIKDVEVL